MKKCAFNPNNQRNYFKETAEEFPRDLALVTVVECSSRMADYLDSKKWKAFEKVTNYEKETKDLEKR